MKVKELAALSEIVSSVAIVVTLVYLAIQAQQTNSALHASSRLGALTADTDYLQAIIEYPELQTLRSMPREALDTNQYNRLLAAIALFIRSREYVWFQYKNGVMDEATLESYISIAGVILASGAARGIWEGEKGRIDREFVAYIDSMLAERDIANQQLMERLVPAE